MAVTIIGGIMPPELEQIQKLFKTLCNQDSYRFPQLRHRLQAPNEQGVYIIMKRNEKIVYVGRTTGGKRGLHQRLRNHLSGLSSFTVHYLNGKGNALREKGYKYKYMVVKDARKRALLEAFTIAHLCPKHIGLGKV